MSVGFLRVLFAVALLVPAGDARPGQTIRLAPRHLSRRFLARTAGTASAPITLTGPAAAVLTKSTTFWYGRKLYHPGGRFAPGYGLWLYRCRALAAERVHGGQRQEGHHDRCLSARHDRRRHPRRHLNGQGIAGQNSADSWLDVKGGNYLIENNAGAFTPPGVLANGYEAHNPTPGSGCGNVWRNNDSDLGDTGRWAINITSTSKCAGNLNVVYASNTVANATGGLTNIAVTA
jgi:hypothetical protein